MNNILELIKNEKVEWKQLGDVCEIGTGKSNRKDEDENGKYPFYVRSKNVLRSNIFQFDEVAIIIPGEGGIGEVFHFVEGKYALHQRAYRIRVESECLQAKYLYYYLTDTFKEYILTKVVGATSISIRKPMLEQMPIPIPTPETQEKIVETLDKFTNYVTELQAELQAELRVRTKQYSYYRDLLLSEEYLNKLSEKIDRIDRDKEFKWTTLEKVAKIKNGRDWKTLDKGNIPVYGSGGPMNVFVNKYSYNKPTVLIPRKGSIENVFYLEEPFWNVDTIFYTEIDNSQMMPKFLYYYIQSFDVKTLSTDSTRPSLTQSALNKVKVPLPSLTIQYKVVEVLDKFQDLLSDTQGLLPEEIKQRKKQYGYYREKLLTFGQESVNTHTHTHTHTQVIPNSYFIPLQEAAKKVGVVLTEGVEWKTLGEIAEYFDGTHQTPKYTNEGVPFVSVENINDLYGTRKYISKTDYDKFRIKPNKGDVFMTRIGDIGTCSIVKNDNDLAYYVTLALIKDRL